MAQYVAEKRDVDFVLFEQLEAQKMAELEKFQDFNQKSFEMIVSEARNFALKEILPTYSEGDRQGVKFENGNVRPPECFRRPFELFREGEWGAVAEEPELGGQGLPHTFATAVSEFLIGTNFSFASYTMLGHGTGKMIELYGTEKQKKLFLKNLYALKWAGTMLLTEPNAGSDVGNLETTAVLNDDGTYSLTGNKIFITSGEHDLTENIIHPVLARIEGEPKGTKGISIFIVPKIWVNDDGSLGERNDIVCTGVEEKMGLHGSATCSMSMGSKGKCRGLLLGEKNKGMKIMFTMMNEARLGVGLQAFSHASAAYLYALNYAKERLQGRSLENMSDHSAPPVAIINHPDVRRMLLEIKAYVEGMRSFTYYTANCFDQAETAEKEEDRELAQGMADLLTPVLKTYNSIKGFDMCVKALQVYGGAGYTRDYPVEQIVRDCKITSIYEGTDGIQAMDLLGRKIGMKNGKVFMNFIEAMQQSVNKAKNFDALLSIAKSMEDAVKRLGDVAMHMGKTAMSSDFKVAFAHSVPFLEVVGDMVMAWMLIWRAGVAESALKNGAKKKDVSFYEGQIKSAEFFINNLIPITLGKIDSIEKSGNAAIEISLEAFGG
ncbi:MAG: acyl-CoA dehydrogenase [Proteobacteria bacterium]|nr:acyl-CoA dehydrogenase [Pseudomonadota bacterium]